MTIINRFYLGKMILLVSSVQRWLHGHLVWDMTVKCLEGSLQWFHGHLQKDTAEDYPGCFQQYHNLYKDMKKKIHRDNKKLDKDCPKKYISLPFPVSSSELSQISSSLEELLNISGSLEPG